MQTPGFQMAGRSMQASIPREEIKHRRRLQVFRDWPRARTGRKDRAPMSKTVPSTRIPNVMVSLGSDRTAVTLYANF